MRYLPSSTIRVLTLTVAVLCILAGSSSAQLPSFEPQRFQAEPAPRGDFMVAPAAAEQMQTLAPVAPPAPGLPAPPVNVAPTSMAPVAAEPLADNSVAGVWQSIHDQGAEFVSALGKIWGIVILNGADGKPLVTIGTLISGVVLLGLGYLAAKWISRWVGSKVLRRVGLEADAAAPVQSITFYALLVMFTMLTLNILNVPITVFSFLGGALAIGAGFGSQNIVNNFISGLILLAERPVRVGDIIEVDGKTGKVVEIGARSTRLSTGNNFEVIVPNSKLLEGTLVNWTLTDDRIGATIKIGVAYGARTRQVGEVLESIALEHPNILKSPPPEASFVDFGDNALMFELKFWLQLRRAGKGSIESDLRYRIDEVFTERGIVVAYPQRDVHLNVIRPVEVRLTESPVAARRNAA